MNIADWIGLGTALIGWVGIVWGFYLFGEYTTTGRRGWRRIPAGAILVYDVLMVMLMRWLSKNGNGKAKK